MKISRYCNTINFSEDYFRQQYHLYYKLDNPDYNYVINSAVRYKTEEPQVHWYCQILPRLSTQAGFEIGSGISINSSLPEEDAKFLKEE